MQAQILRLNLAGQPLEWLSWEEAACLYVRELVTWTLGGVVQTVHGGINRQGERSTLDLSAIIACGGDRMARPRTRPPLNNRALFARDEHTCLYCGSWFPIRELTRDHVHPVSKGGMDVWENVVTACRRCNQYKGNRLLENIEMDLLALPFAPNAAEYLALTNSARIRGDQMEFLRGQFSRKRHEGWLADGMPQAC